MLIFRIIIIFFLNIITKTKWFSVILPDVSNMDSQSSIDCWRLTKRITKSFKPINYKPQDHTKLKRVFQFCVFAIFLFWIFIVLAHVSTQAAGNLCIKWCQEIDYLWKHFGLALIRSVWKVSFHASGGKLCWERNSEPAAFCQQRNNTRGQIFGLFVTMVTKK